MTTMDLTADQRHKLLMAVVERRDCFHRVTQGMDAKGWDKADPVYVAVVKAHDAAQVAVAAIHDAGKVMGRIGNVPQWRKAMGPD